MVNAIGFSGTHEIKIKIYSNNVDTSKIFDLGATKVKNNAVHGDESLLVEAPDKYDFGISNYLLEGYRDNMSSYILRKNNSNNNVINMLD